MSGDNKQKLGLRERKKLKTRATIQHNALRLFREQGYTETTVEQIAEASEISPSTFFRYFPTKESVVVEDDYDPFLIEAFKKQPPDISVIQAFRAAVIEGFKQMTLEEKKDLQDRTELMMAIPELRAASMTQMIDTFQMMNDLVAKRVGRDSQNIEIQTFTGALLGAIIASQFNIIQNRIEDPVQAIMDTLKFIEDGMPL